MLVGKSCGITPSQRKLVIHQLVEFSARKKVELKSTTKDPFFGNTLSVTEILILGIHSLMIGDHPKSISFGSGGCIAFVCMNV